MIKNSTLKTSLILGIAVTVCTQLAIPTFAQNNPRSGFQTIKVPEFISSNKIKVSTPKALAVQLYGDDQDQEGRKSEEISVTYPTTKTSTILHTVVGLADDSVAALRQRIELRRTSTKWEIVWVGRQSKCQPGRGHQDWSANSCL